MTRAKRRGLAGEVAGLELKDRLERARAALLAIKRAPDSTAARALETDLNREIRSLKRDLASG